MRTAPHPLYLLVRGDYYERLDTYQSRQSVFRELVSAHMPTSWTMEQRGIWRHCSRPENIVPYQGWKIHLSSRLDDANRLLRKISQLLFEYGSANFKFATDPLILRFMNGKNCPRGGAGKFVTIYPPDTPAFVHLIEEIYKSANGMEGPYILSDYRYKDSKVVFYRYGGMRRRDLLSYTGERVPVLINPQGRQEPDHRLPYPVIPTWVDSPFPQQTALSQAPDTCRLKDGRYKIESVISFSNSGGVYCAIDRTSGQRVVIKEARPWINEMDAGCDAIELLKKEYRILSLLADADICPKPIDMFFEWEHCFLAQEYIAGLSLHAHSIEHNILLRTRASAARRNEWWSDFCALAKSLIDNIDILHRRKIVLGDLSARNLIVRDEELRLAVIDFEAACEIGIDCPISLHTPGFASPDRAAGSSPQFADDYYAVGAVLLACIFPINSFLLLRPEAARDFLQSVQAEISLPSQIIDLILSLLHPDPARRPGPTAMRAVLESIDATEIRTPTVGATLNHAPVIHDVVTHLQSAASYERRDRLFPSDARVFSTNPLSLAYGASGVVYALAQITGKVPEQCLDWILSSDITPASYPPGLYLGLAGISWSLLEIGRHREAEDILKLSFDHPLLYAASDVFYGLSGWGMTCLRFFQATQDQLYLDKAILAGKKLLETRKESIRGNYWDSSDEIQVGLAHGASGIGLFLLSLYLATSNIDFFSLGEQALKFDLSFGVENKDGGLSWPSSVNSNSIFYPYWRFGSAGIGVVLLRFWFLVQDPYYRAILDKIFLDVDRKYALMPGRFLGLAGIGDFLLDMHEFTNEQAYLDSARKVAQGINLYQVKRTGTIFPGDSLYRLCCDYGTGSAGIALFLARLEYGGKCSFMLDSLFGSHAKAMSKAV